ncbi:MAG: hypoxanthine phosphoribosyltransferase [Acidimicrobiaceae bacterium]|nr:hypoxanthine phosphoribosyltransferase [Acidimicrobiaceae bacterium]
MTDAAGSDLRILLDSRGIESTVERVAADVSADHNDGVVLVGVLRGSVPFLADLARAMSIRVRIDFLSITPYSPGTGRVRLLKDLDIDVTGRDVVMVEDIVDTGLTSEFLSAQLNRRNPRRLSVCTFVDRPVRRAAPVRPDYVGIGIPEEFVIGYGLDYEGRYRNLPMLAAANPAVLKENPDAHIAALYRF